MGLEPEKPAGLQKLAIAMTVRMAPPERASCTATTPKEYLKWHRKP